MIKPPHYTTCIHVCVCMHAKVGKLTHTVSHQIVCVYLLGTSWTQIQKSLRNNTTHSHTHRETHTFINISHYQILCNKTTEMGNLISCSATLKTYLPLSALSCRQLWVFRLHVLLKRCVIRKGRWVAKKAGT